MGRSDILMIYPLVICYITIEAMAATQLVRSFNYIKNGDFPVRM